MSNVVAKVALVTGGAAGFGLAIADTLISKGYHVTVVDISLESDSQSEDGNRLLFKGDVTKRGDWENAVSKTVKKWGRLDVVVVRSFMLILILILISS